MATSKKKKPSVLKKLAVSDSDDASLSDLSLTDRKEDKDVPRETKTASAEAASVITRIATFDRKAKSILHEVYEEIQDILRSEKFFPEIKDEMTAEFGDIFEVIQTNQSDIYEELCPIVITGETSAGKSTFVNLLLGVELLPQSPLTCTSPVCRISNREYKSIVLTDGDNRQENLVLPNNESSEEMKKILKDYICATKAGEKYKAVDICWPIPCLQNKIMIVDTPGISPDNDVLTERLFEYLPSALAFIYVINPTNAGGVQSDRLERILNEQEKRRFMGVRSFFDPRRAIFVCNKWDQIHEDEEQVFDHIKQKLQEKWTNFDKKKLFKISAWEEMQRSKNGKSASENYKCLLQGIDKMVPACLEEKIFRHANWQKYFLERLNFKLSARVSNAIRTEEDKRIMAKKVLKRIQKVRDDLKSVQVKLKNLAREQCQQTAGKLLHHLLLPETRERIFSTVEEELPENGNIDTIEAEVTSIIEHKLVQQIKSWLRETNNGGLDEFLSDTFQNECSIIESDCTEIDELILGRNFITNIFGIALGQQSQAELPFFSNMSTASKVAFFAAIPAWGPFALIGGLFALPFGIGHFIRKTLKRKESIREFQLDRASYVRKISHKILNEVDESFLKEKVFDRFLKEMNGHIDQFCENTVPRRITAGEKLVKGIRREIRQPIEVRKQCLQVDIKFKSVYGRVLYIHMEYFNMLTIKQSNLRQANEPNTFEVFVKGNWVETKAKNRKWSYDKNEDCCLLSDIHILRTITHVNILNVLGITFTALKRGRILQIHTKRCEKSLDTALFHSTKQDEPWIVIKTYLCHSLQGLLYLHEHGFNHGNLKPTNILITDGIAKISDVGIRTPLLKGSSGVLQSLFYGRELDVFRFGIVLWESWYRQSALDTLDEELPPSLEPYEQISFVLLSGTKPEFHGKISKKLKLLIEDCWGKDPVDRPSVRLVLERLQNVS